MSVGFSKLCLACYSKFVNGPTTHIIVITQLDLMT
jgi:hypothetical protein